MKRALLAGLVICLGVGVILNAGCARKAESAKEAIEQAKTLESVEQKVDYLLKQARAFYNSKEFQESIQIAQYVLSNLDKDSLQAKDLIEKAKAKLKEAAEQAADDVTKKLFGK